VTADYLGALDAEKPAVVGASTQLAVIARSFAPDQWLCGIVDVAGIQGLMRR
jgi:hypothetical protein